MLKNLSKSVQNALKSHLHLIWEKKTSERLIHILQVENDKHRSFSPRALNSTLNPALHNTPHLTQLTIKSIRKESISEDYRITKTKRVEEATV